jgi:pimeloyl-ACP methyl ester carboxylesterase
MSKIHVYFMPGLAASSLIFEFIKLPNDVFEMHYLEWQMPIKDETLSDYAKRMSDKILYDNAVLIGVSFGGVLVQEMAIFLKLRKLIIVSSVKTNDEVPIRMKLAKKTKAYKLLPVSLLQDINALSKLSFGNIVKDRLDLYERYLSMRQKEYLEWAIEQMILWSRTEPDKDVIHIHGDTDGVFPIKNIQNCIVIKGGTHIMIITKYKWFNENLPKIILDQIV